MHYIRKVRNRPSNPVPRRDRMTPGQYISRQRSAQAAADCSREREVV